MHSVLYPKKFVAFTSRLPRFFASQSETTAECAALREECRRLQEKCNQLQQQAENDARSRLSAPLLTPRALGDRLDNLKFIIIGTCQVDHLAAAAADFGYSADHILHDSYSFSELPAANFGAYDAALVGLTLRNLLHEAVGRSIDVVHTLETWTPDAANAALDRLKILLEALLERFHQMDISIPVFFTSFIEPSFNYQGRLVTGTDATSMNIFIRMLNDLLLTTINKYPNFFFFDLNQSLNTVGRAHLQDDAVTHFTHSSIITDWDDHFDGDRIIAPVSNSKIFDVDRNLKILHALIYNELADCIQIIRQVGQVKIIIVDLDDTLWRGVAAEDSVEGWIRNEGWPLGFVESLLFFKRRGGLLAICSKNEEEPTRERFKQIWTDRITLDDFVSVKINWRPKSENINEILQEVNLLPESALFIDDNPREIDEVRVRFPALRCLGGNHHDWRRIVLRAPETQVAHITRESRERTQLVRAKIEREASSRALCRDEWLRSLQLKLRLCLLVNAQNSSFARAFELLNKTNQFNTTGKRWSPAELEAFFAAGGCLLTASLRDNTTDNGLIGVTMIKDGEIVQSVLSCRVFGLGAEIAMGAFATAVALTNRTEARASVVDTGKNLTSHDFFERIGFSRGDGEFLAAAACPTPDWIELDIDERLAPHREKVVANGAAAQVVPS